MDQEKYDLIVIGGGPGGYVAAIRAAKLGGKVALIEQDKLGGTCLNRGCIPTKTLIHGTMLYKNIKTADEWGITVDNLDINIEQLIAKKNMIVDNLRSGIEKLIVGNKIAVFKGFGKVLSQEQVMVCNEENEVTLKTRSIILATGSVPNLTAIPGIESEGVITSDLALSLNDIPNHLVIIGAGVIGLEFACLYASLGSKVTILEALPNILPMVDDDITKRLIPIWKKQGIKIETSAKVNKIILEKDQGINVNYLGKYEEGNVLCDKVLVASGRNVCIERASLAKLGLEFDHKFIKVNQLMQTNLPNIFAIGDIVNTPMLAHVASAEGIIAAENAMGLESKISYDVIPNCIFSSPEIAHIGLTEKLAREKYHEVLSTKIPFSSNGRALTLGENIGMLKIIIDAKTQKILGAHLFGPSSSELIAEIALAMKNSLMIKAVAETIHSHPSLSEIIQEAAHSLLGSPIHTL